MEELAKKVKEDMMKDNEKSQKDLLKWEYIIII